MRPVRRPFDPGLDHAITPVRLARRLTATTLFLAAGACGAEPESEASATVTDSAGVRIVTNRWPGEGGVPEWRLAETPELSIGDDAPSEEYELFRVYYARSFQDGRIVISMNLTEARVYSSEGEHLLTIGREGEGPGEFTFLWDAHPVGDSLVRTLDLRNQRTSFFDAGTGELVNEVPVLGFSNPNGVAPLADGSYVGLASPQRDEDPETPDRFVVRFHQDGAAADTIAPLFAAVPYRLATLGEPLPQFQPSLASTAAGEYVWAGWEGEYAIRRWGADGRLQQIVRLDYPGEPVTAEIRDSVTSSQSEFAEAEMDLEYEFPERIPAWDKLLATASGWLWVRRTRPPFPDAKVYDVFDPDGRLTAWVRIPADARLSEVGDDHVLGLFPNELEIETVRRYRILEEPADPGN